MNGNVVGIANLLSLLIPLAAKAYNEIRANHSDLKPLEDVLASADADWDVVIEKAQIELAKMRADE